jgi:hypothetical protein
MLNKVVVEKNAQGLLKLLIVNCSTQEFSPPIWADKHFLAPDQAF